MVRGYEIFGIILKFLRYIGLNSAEYLWGTKDIQVIFPMKANLPAKKNFYAISAHIRYPAKELHTLLVETFKSRLMPGYHVTVDEIRIPCSHSGCSWKTYNPDKPDVWAIESKSFHADNSYLLDFIFPLDENKPTPNEAFFGFAKNLAKNSYVFKIFKFLTF